MGKFRVSVAPITVVLIGGMGFTKTGVVSGLRVVDALVANGA